MELIWYALLSVIGISLISFVGVFSLSFGKYYLHNILLYIISFAAGTLLGNVFLHLIPKALENQSSPINIGFFILIGIFTFFIFEKILHEREHHLHTKVQAFGIMNLVGDALHNFIDGMALATSFLISIPLGIATTIAIALHELPKEFSDFGILLHAGFSIRQALWYNFLSALSAIGGTLFVFLMQNIFHNALYYLIPFTAGGFIYIGASTLIPELKKTYTIKKIFLQSFFFGLGILIMLVLALYK